MLKVGAGYIQCLQSRRENSILSCPGTLHFQHRFGIPWIEMWKDAVRVLYTFCVWVTGWQTGKEWQEKEEYRRTRTRRWMKTRRRIICNFGHLQLLVICGYWWLQVIGGGNKQFWHFSQPRLVLTVSWTEIDGTTRPMLDMWCTLHKCLFLWDFWFFSKFTKTSVAFILQMVLVFGM